MSILSANADLCGPMLLCNSLYYELSLCSVELFILLLQELKLEVQGLTETCPPSDPYSPVVDMFLAVGNFQEYMEKRQLSQLQGGVESLSALDIFSNFVESWMADSQVRYQRKKAILHCTLTACPSDRSGKQLHARKKILIEIFL